MKEHLVYMTAEDTDDLIERLHDLNQRIEVLRNRMLDTNDEVFRETMKPTWKRLEKLRRELLRALKQSLEGLE